MKISKSDIFIDAVRLCVNGYIYDGARTNGDQDMYARYACSFLDSIIKEIADKFEIKEEI